MRENRHKYTVCLNKICCYLLELVTAGRLKISVPGCAFPARQLILVKKKLVQNALIIYMHKELEGFRLT